MTPMTRLILILALMFPIAAGVFAQETSTAAAATTTVEGETATTTNPEAATAAAAKEGETAEGTEPRSVSAYEVRNMFGAMLRNEPQELAMILKLDPSLMSNEAFVSGYPELAKFIAKRPEVKANPRFYLAEFPMPGQMPRSALNDFFEMVAVLGGFGLAAFALGWFIRTVIEQRRWNRLSKQQAEVHNKILDRFSTSQEVLEYIKTPAGTKFLESAPIPVHAEKAARPAPQHSRVLLTIQIGIVFAIAAFGVLLVSLRFEGEAAAGFFAMGAIGFCVGVGFIVSAIVSLLMTRRLALWQAHENAPGALDDTGLVR